VPRFLGFEARLIPGHVGAYRCLGWGCLVDLGHGNGGGLGFGGVLLQAAGCTLGSAEFLRELMEAGHFLWGFSA
jgi:hypothetical protein